MSKKRPFAISLVLLLAATTVGAADFSGVWERDPNPYKAGVDYAPPPGGTPDLREPYANSYKNYIRNRDAALKRGEPLPDPSILCKPEGMPTLMAGAPYYIEILQAKDKVVVLTEFLSQTRRIFLGAKLPPLEEISFGYSGYSAGHWEGETLVVHTAGVREDVQMLGIPHSRNMQIIERIRLISMDRLQDQFLIEDPATLAKPYKFTVEYRRVPGYQIMEYVCDNNRWHVDEHGQSTLQPVTQ
ncbi:MAG: hypothetical protein ABI859_00120 [Pseudomonadota bacterium]